MEYMNLDKTMNKSIPANVPESSDEKNQKCQRCMKSFPTSQQLLQHSLVHTNLRKFPCRYCDKSFKQLSHVQQHLRIHTGERPYRCVIEGCTKAFRQLSSLQQHLKGHSLNPKNPHYKSEYDQRRIKSGSDGMFLPKPHDLICQICEKQCANDQRFFRHIHKYHPEYWRVFSGGLPLSNFLSPDATSSSKDNPFLCSICNKRYIHRTGYIKHMSSHIEKQKNFCASLPSSSIECQVCKKVFSKDAFLLRHLEMKTDSGHRMALEELKKISLMKNKSDRSLHVDSFIWRESQHPSQLTCAPSESDCKTINSQVNNHLSKLGSYPYISSGDTNQTSYLTFPPCLPPTLPSSDASRSLEAFAFNQEKYFSYSKPVILGEPALGKSHVRELQSCYQEPFFIANGLGSSSVNCSEVPSYLHHGPPPLEYYPSQSTFTSSKSDVDSFHENLNVTIHSQLHPVQFLASEEPAPYYSKTPQNDVASALQHLARYTPFR